MSGTAPLLRRKGSYGTEISGEGSLEEEGRSTSKKRRRCMWPNPGNVCVALLLLLALIAVLSELSKLVRSQNRSKPPPPFGARGFSIAGEARAIQRKVSGSRGSALALAHSTSTRMDNVSLWEVKGAENYHCCLDAGSSFQALLPGSASAGHLLIQLSGGLNQERSGIIDAVVVARILNATLVLPAMDHTSFWADNSSFEDIFDAEHFIRTLEPDIRVVRTVALPGGSGMVAERRVPRKSKAAYYESTVRLLLQQKKMLRLTKFDFRLADDLPHELQKLRCRANYRALQFTPAISSVATLLVSSLRALSPKYIAVHLRYEPDMLAFSGCTYGGGQSEERAFQEIRKRWVNLLPMDPEVQRRKGKCLLTPYDIGLLLQALGYPSTTHIYLASGDIYGGQASLAPLKALFPNIHTKETLMDANTLASLAPYSARRAAIDYSVSLESDVFVANNRGNMARAVGGHRRCHGFKKTIRSNVRKLGLIFGGYVRNLTSWAEVEERVAFVQQGFMGDVADGGKDFLEHPGACICQRGSDKQRLRKLLCTNGNSNLRST
eukprot:TRINITY_DN11597_c0_g1_i1.p1 TRINITY_DN11597_c0_g1~~TRINITY_DN11597_c0_g1_i1.p1  ORF type:complete len:551 (+),score=76.63 TRINITY_DN11597_c0_g1_i1:175-1827(+)